MSSQNNEISNGNSLSLIFKKPKSVLKTSRMMKSDRSQNRNIESQRKNIYNQNSSQSLKNTINFSSRLESTNGSVTVNKKRRVPLNRQKPRQVSFSKSINVSNNVEDSVMMENGLGYLRRLRHKAKPSMDANFSADIPTVDEGIINAKNKNVDISVLKVSEKDSLGISPLSPPSWNSASPNNERRIRRCSTPLQGKCRSNLSNSEANFSLIPRVLPFLENEDESSPSVISNARNNSKNDTNKDSSKQSTDGSSKSISNSTSSFVTKVFQSEETLPLHTNENLSPPNPTSKRTQKILWGIRRKPVFPKFAPYCNKMFYQYLIYKITPKYGIQTNRRVVTISEKVHCLVQCIIEKKTNYQQSVHRLQKLLYSRNIIRTSYDLYLFSLKFLPRDAAVKIVPIIQPFGLPVSVDFDSQSVFDPL